MKTDNYLTLCVEQAAKSPLHFRHGCVIVRGGRVVGKGFNDYRPGYNGGTLKSGRLSRRYVNSVHAMESKRGTKEKLKLKPDSNPEFKSTKATFTPFEIVGDGSKTNGPLSMHSEMAAIFSASTTQVSNSLLSQKPSVRVPGGSKRKARKQQEALKLYVETVCNAALATQAEECTTLSYRGQYGETPGEERERTTTTCAATEPREI